MVGTRDPCPTSVEVLLDRDELGDLPCRIATNADGKSLAAPQARPECTPIAA
jgi:hypothetical protein